MQYAEIAEQDRTEERGAIQGIELRNSTPNSLEFIRRHLQHLLNLRVTP